MLDDKVNKVFKNYKRFFELSDDKRLMATAWKNETANVREFRKIYSGNLRKVQTVEINRELNNRRIYDELQTDTRQDLLMKADKIKIPNVRNKSSDEIRYLLYLATAS